MKISQSEFIVDIHSFSHDGRGIGMIEGKTAFIHGAIQDEKVKCKITKKHPRYVEGEVTEILSPSPSRVTPNCSHFSICGGCSMQHVSADAQVQFQQKIVLEQLKHFGRVTPEFILPPLSSDNVWGYRHKARLGVRYVRKKSRLLIGFREKASRYLADIQHCSVLHPSVGTRIEALSHLIASLTQYEQIPQIEVAVGDHETAFVIRHMTELPESDREKLCEFGSTHQISLYLQPNSPNPIEKIWPKNSSALLTYTLSDYDLTMHFHPLDFTQVNNKMNLQMIKQALQLLELTSEETVLDLFCGLGNFTLPMARFAKEVTGIEGSEEMVMRAEENAASNNITNTNFHKANLMEPDTQAAWMKKSYDKILLDPPRTGAKEIIAFFPRFSAKRIVYVSCNPATFARDAGELVHTHGYRLSHAGIINMFPHTSHVETIALFVK